jgi:hypothetical protein
MKFEFLRQIFGKISNISFYQNAFRGIQIVSCGQTDGRT